MKCSEYIKYDGWRLLMWIILSIVWAAIAVNLILVGMRDSESKAQRLSKGLLASRTISERFVSNVVWAGENEKAEICYRTDYLYHRPKKNISVHVNGTQPTTIPKFHELPVTALNYFVLFDRMGSAFLVWVVSLIMDAGVIYYHVRNRPHPKFTLTGCRLFVIVSNLNIYILYF